MIAELMSTVGKIVPQIGSGVCVDAEQRGALTLLRQAIVSNGRETTPLESAWLSMIDQCLCDNPSPELIFAAMKEVDRPAPANSKAIGINLV